SPRMSFDVSLEHTLACFQSVLPATTKDVRLRVLEVGCGRGARLARSLYAAGHRVTGVDPAVTPTRKGGGEPSASDPAPATDAPTYDLRHTTNMLEQQRVGDGNLSST